MTPAAKGRTAASNSEFEHKTVHILVRWLLLVIAFHFVAQSSVDPGELAWAVRASLLFGASNMALMPAPRRWFASPAFTRAWVAFDFAFVALSLYFLRESGAHYHWLFAVLLAWLAWRRELRLVLPVLGAALAADSIVTWLATGRWVPFADTGDFLRSLILFAVAVFYFYVVELLDRNTALFHVVARARSEWERTADSMSELILLVNADGRIRRVNRALAGRLNRHPPELIGRLWHEVLDGAASPAPESPLARMFAAGAVIEEAAWSHAALGGAMRVCALPVFDGDSLVEAVYVLRA